MSGFPPRLLHGEPEDQLVALGVRSGSVLVLKESLGVSSSSSSSATNAPKKSTVFVRRVVAADNSCLFNAIGYALGKGLTGNSDAMRQLIRDAILADPTKYSDVFLGRPVHEYCAWILDPQSWGGEIELSILCSHFQMEIVVFDVTCMGRLCYGEDQGFSQRIFLLYDGIHYDVIVETPMEDAKDKSSSRDVTCFAINDFDKLERASEVAVEAHQRHEFTDLSNFTIQCYDCHQSFKGQQEAQRHANESGHRHFGEILRRSK